MSKALLIPAILVVSTVAFAQGLPTWDVQTYCKRRAQKSGMTTSELVDACVEAEKASLAELKASWSGYTAASREKCLKEADQHYADLQACIVAAEASQHTLAR
jgi:hypothetical protein